MEEGFLAKIVKEEGAKEIQVGEVWEFLTFGDLLIIMGSHEVFDCEPYAPFSWRSMNIQ